MKTLHNKFCNYCKTTKPVSEFYQKKGKEVKKKNEVVLYLASCQKCLFFLEIVDLIPMHACVQKPSHNFKLNCNFKNLSMVVVRAEK